MRRALVLALLAGACLPKTAGAPAGEAFRDDFERAELGAKYLKRGGSWRIADGALTTFGDHNQPLFLDVPLGRNVRVEFDAWSDSDDVDTKVEIFGDGVRHESGYIVIFGGWKNALSVIARLDEHEPARKSLKTRWEKGRRYHWTLERKDGHTLTWLVDGTPLLAYDDAHPLVGARNDRLAFTSWESEVHYDNLAITPLP